MINSVFIVHGYRISDHKVRTLGKYPEQLHSNHIVNKRHQL